MESAFASLSASINLSLGLVIGFVDRVIDGLVGTADFHGFLLMDVEAHHEAVVLDFEVFETLLADTALGDLTTENLRANIVLARKHKLHLVKDKRNLLLVLQRAVSLDLDLLNDLGSLINLAIGLVHFNELARGLCILALHKDLAISRSSQRAEHKESLLA